MSYANKRISDEDLVGQVFGYRTVVRYKGLREGREYWECLCRCGKVKYVQAQALKSGKAKSCGCLKSEKILTYNESRRHSDPWVAEMNSHAYHIAWDRKNKNKTYKTWDMSLNEYKALCSSPCFYCGEAPSGNPITRLMGKLGIRKNGIDRKDNSKGYEAGNCVSCCTACNRDKGAQRMCDFIEKTMKRYEYLKAKNWLLPHEEDDVS